MADITLVQAIISSVLSGGGTAATAVLTMFRDSKKRLASLEDRLGSNEDPKTGLHATVERVEEIVKRLKREIEAWPDDPPEWLMRAVNRSTRTNLMTHENQRELERLIEQRYKSNAGQIARLEEQFDALEKTLNDFIERSEYERDARVRSEELAKIREQLATSNGLLRGVMTALGYIDPEGRKRG